MEKKFKRKETEKTLNSFGKVVNKNKSPKLEKETIKEKQSN